MALVFMDGFDHLQSVLYDPVMEYSENNQLWYKWEKGYLLGDPRIEHHPGWLRRPAPSDWPIGYLVFHSVWYQAWIFRQFNEDHYNTLIFGYAFLGYPGFNQPNSPEITFYDTDGNRILYHYPIDEVGRVRVSLYGGDLSETYYSDTNTTEEWTWYHVEVKIVFDDTTGGSVIVRVNETEVINQTGIQTYKSGGDSDGNFSFSQIKIEKGLHNTFFMDDLFILDGEGSVANDFIGDVRVDTVYPNANGDYINFDPNPSDNSNWENVKPYLYDIYNNADKHATHTLRSFDYTAPGADINTYNESLDTVRECYNHESLLSLNKPIFGIQTNSIFRKTDAGQKRVEQFIRVGSTDYDSGRIIDVPDWNRNYYYPVTVNPNTTVAWTESDIAALQSGIKIVV